MNIQPFKSDSVPVPAKPAARPTKPVSQPPADEPLEVGKRDKLAAALANEPDVRATEVARGKELAADPGYPSDELLAKLAEVFVNDAKPAK